MADSGQSADCYGGNEWESYPYTGTGPYPTDNLDAARYLRTPENPTMETILNSQPDPTNISVQGIDPFDSQQHGQTAATNHQISFPGQPSSDPTNISVQTNGTPRMTKEQQAERRKEINRKSRAKKKNDKIDMANKLKELEDEKKLKQREMENKFKEFEDEKDKFKQKIAKLKDADVSMRENLQSLTDEKAKLESNLEKLREERDEQNALVQELLKDKIFIEEGDKHCIKPTQDPSASDEEGHPDKEIWAGNLDGGDSEDDNDSKKKNKRAARSAPSEGRSGKVPKVACYDARADQRHGSTSNPTAMVSDPYSIAECLRILKSMGDIPYDPVVKKARTIFQEPNEREFFVELTENWRRRWVKDLENGA